MRTRDNATPKSVQPPPPTTTTTTRESNNNKGGERQYTREATQWPPIRLKHPRTVNDRGNLVGLDPTKRGGLQHKMSNRSSVGQQLTTMNFKRRRRTPYTTTAVAVAATLMVGVGAVENGQPRRDYHGVEDHAAATADHHAEEDEATFRRRLGQSAAETFASWTSDPQKITRAMPLDLKLDEDSGEAYISGRHSYLEPYAETFAKMGGGEDVNGEYWNHILSVNTIMHGDSHWQRGHITGRPKDDRLYYKILEEDGIEARTQGLRGGAKRQLLDVNEAGGSGADATFTVHLDSVEFGRVGELEEQEEEGEDSAFDQGGRSLQEEESYASAFTKTRGGNKRKQNKKNKNNNNNQGGNIKANRKKSKLPQLERLRPLSGQTVEGAATFSARIKSSQATGSPIDSVHFRLKDDTGSQSDWIDVPKKSGNLYEIAIEGFDGHPGTYWEWTMQASDRNGKKKSSDAMSFTIDGVGNDSGKFADSGGTGGNSGGGGNNNGNYESSQALLPERVEADADWAQGGAIQAAVGRILFEFPSTPGQSFVCSGTVVCDGDRGRSPNTGNGRSIIQTAAHCLYNDVLKEFASKAIFIPDQGRTRGDESDVDCDNDPYGCWHLSFGTVSKGWTIDNFPENVPYDYAYYTVFDDASTHKGGYKSGLTGILDRDIPCVPIDFDSNPLDDKSFIWSIGHSADHDPDLRHCAMNSKRINGVDFYTNFWLEDCALTGGASGGPWIKDMDTEGVGTLTSINSWGFVHKPGMAGPQLHTSSGSMAECMFDVARSSDRRKEEDVVVEKWEC